MTANPIAGAQSGTRCTKGAAFRTFSGRLASFRPLAPATLIRSGGRFRLNWTEKRQNRSVTAWGDAPFGEALEAAVASAHKAEPGTLPVTATEAGRAVTFGYFADGNPDAWITRPVTALLLWLGLAFWLNQPLFLLPTVGAGWLADLFDERRFLMLRGDQLWILERECEPHLISVSTVTGTVSHPQTTDLLTDDPLYPEIRLNLYRSGSLLRELKRRKAGTA